MSSEQVVHVEITSFIGIGFGASHYYGELVGDVENEYKKVELQRTLSRAAARRLNDLHGAGSTYQSGMEVRGFDSEQDIIDVAIQVYRSHFPKATILLLGNAAIVDPQPVLDGPDMLKDLSQRLIKEADAFGWYEGNRKRMRQVEMEWDTALKQAKVVSVEVKT